MTWSPPKRSLVIPVLDWSPHSPHNIGTLLDDLRPVEGEVIVVFNGPACFEALRDHPRIDKYCLNKHNAGVGRAWNQGLDLAEGRAAHILNADLHVEPGLFDELEGWLFSLERAVAVGPQGSLVDLKRLAVTHYLGQGQATEPVRSFDVSGFLFSLHLPRFLAAGLRFDPRFAPCMFEEWDLGLQAMTAGLAVYTVPVRGYTHQWGASVSPDRVIDYFGRPVRLSDVAQANRRKFREKWAEVIDRLP